MSGPVRYLLDYFIPRVGTVVLHEQPMPSSEDLAPTLEIYRRGTLVYTRRFPPCLLRCWLPRNPRPERTYFRLKVRDLISSIYFSLAAFRFTGSADLFIGVESLNALWGASLKFLGRAKCSVYYLFDFSPRRYPSSIVNRLYLRLDRRATYACDATWNISPAIEEARIRMGYDRRKMERQVTVPYGVEVKEVPVAFAPPGSAIKIAYAGGINRENGVMFLPGVIKKLAAEFPRALLVVMGSGSLEDEFLQEVTKLDIKKHVDYRGYLPAEEVRAILEECHIGLAPYYPMESTKMYGDVIKIKTYLAAGLPVITTGVPPASRDIEEREMGMVVPYDADRWAEAIGSLLADRSLCHRCRRNALDFIKEQTWENILTGALARTFPRSKENADENIAG